jgi:hypothetical protein
MSSSSKRAIIIVTDIKKITQKFTKVEIVMIFFVCKNINIKSLTIEPRVCPKA